MSSWIWTSVLRVWPKFGRGSLAGLEHTRSDTDMLDNVSGGVRSDFRSGGSPKQLAPRRAQFSLLSV